MKLIPLLILLLTGCQEKQIDKPSAELESNTMNEVIPGKTITIEQLEEMFANISEKTEWDMKGSMLWGYFFTNSEPKALEPIRDQLVAEGYRYVDLYQSDQEDQDGPPVWWLHVEKAEAHTPQTLDQRNNTFYLLAAKHEIRSYDGMDIGPIQ